MAQRNTQTILNRQILLDTSVLRCLLDKQFRYRVFNWLTHLVNQQGNILGVSEISRFEITRRSDVGPPERKAIFNLIAKMNVVPISISSNVITNASIFCRTVKPNQIKDGSKKDMTVDMIVAGNVIGNKNTILMTSDRGDFCAPYWKILAEKCFMRRQKEGGWNLVNIYILDLDYNQLSPEDFSEEIRDEFFDQRTLGFTT